MLWFSMCNSANSETLRFYSARHSNNQCLTTILAAEAQSAQRTTEKLLDSCAKRINPQKTASSLFSFSIGCHHHIAGLYYYEDLLSHFKIQILR